MKTLVFHKVLTFAISAALCTATLALSAESEKKSATETSAPLSTSAAASASVASSNSAMASNGARPFYPVRNPIVNFFNPNPFVDFFDPKKILRK